MARLVQRFHGRIRMPPPREDEPENELMETRGEPEERSDTVERSVPCDGPAAGQETPRPAADEPRIERFEER
jgi:hypothetical protein